MPCNSIAIGQANLANLVPWMLSQMHDELARDAVLEAVCARLSELTGEKVDMQQAVYTGWAGLRRVSLGREQPLPARAITIYHGASPWVQLWLYPEGEPVVVDIPALDQSSMAGYALQAAEALQLAAVDIAKEAVIAGLMMQGATAKHIEDAGPYTVIAFEKG